jgi:hypothetical protein
MRSQPVTATSTSTPPFLLRYHRCPVILPAGTKLVVKSALPGARGVYPAGSLGVIVTPPDDPTHSYRVRMPDGHELAGR